MQSSSILSITLSLLMFSVDSVPCSEGVSQSNKQNETKNAPANGLSNAWNYRMSGNLDEQNLSCRGTARVTVIGEPGQSKCVEWSVSKQQCKGSRSVDWLHESTTTGRVCEDANGWELKKRLPGRASCVPQVAVKDGEVLSLSVSCTWECRSTKNRCAGQATYEFSPKSLP
jgi:hypothetical protein